MTGETASVLQQLGNGKSLTVVHVGYIVAFVVLSWLHVTKAASCSCGLAQGSTSRQQCGMRCYKDFCNAPSAVKCGLFCNARHSRPQAATTPASWRCVSNKHRISSPKTPRPASFRTHSNDCDVTTPCRMQIARHHAHHCTPQRTHNPHLMICAPDRKRSGTRQTKHSHGTVRCTVDHNCGARRHHLKAQRRVACERSSHHISDR